MKSIRARLLIGLLSGTLLCTLVATFMLYRLADHEADEQSDLRLLQVAWALPLQMSDAVRIPVEPDFDDVVLAQVWNRDGARIYVSEPSHALPRQEATGYRTIAARGERWRVYAEVRAGYFVQVAQPIAVRKRVAAHMALRVMPPLLLLLPALAVMIWVVVGAALRPLERLAQAVRGRSASALQPLDTDGLPPELMPIAASLNSLLIKIDSAMSAQRNFVADAAHELRSPLTALKLQLQLAERAGDEAARAESFRKLHERLDRSTHLVQQLLTLARHEQTQAPPPRLPCDLLALAQTVVSDHAIHAETKGIDLGIAEDASSLVAQVHVEGFKVMLSNLVDNALRYTQAGGQVDVAVAREHGRACLRVSDNGPGVPPAERARLFDRFYRPDGNALWGCGLGMSIVKNVVDGHGAEIELSSNASGVGLVVTVRLPAAA
ncbi:ATP-binding protein [Duganella aceris]|uniref:histidine kinase n=1 Tax=Duganella aceris TaxID=2703883 RepID=A0ABX0FJV5_9BURK|nr:ATP-binding protein [Duganella aceris]NGZ84802.1 two-component sensor histidine kinase [Duganella aceris]